MVEDVIPLYGTEIAVRVDAPVESVTIVPGQKEIEYFSDEEAGKITFTVPEICGHEMIEIKGGKL